MVHCSWPWRVTTKPPVHALCTAMYLLTRTMKQTDVFVPFAFEVGGAMGDESEDFLREAAKVAE